MDGWIRHRAPKAAVAPDEVTLPGRLETSQLAWPFARFVIAATRDVNENLVKYRRIQEEVSTVSRLRGLRVDVEFPEQLAGLSLERTDPTVALRSDNLGGVPELDNERAGVFPKEDVRTRRVILP